MLKKSLAVLLVLVFSLTAFAHDDTANPDDSPIHAEANEDISPEWDIVRARVSRYGSNLVFHLVLAGEAGSNLPEATGDLANAPVYSYVFPTSLDSSAVGFEAEAGILALAITSHPDFDDTPLWDENSDGDTANDGAEWHAHWVVLVQDEACAAGLKVRDIPEGESPQLPETWAQLPLYLDSPDYALELYQNELVVNVPHSAIGNAESFNFDGVTAGLRVNANLHNPLLCVEGVFDIASGDLSLSGEAR